MLIIITTHPIQYQVPLWKSMTDAGIELEVWFFTDFGINKSLDKEFGKSFAWDLPMLEGYNYRFLKVNDKAIPNNGFNGIVLKENIKKLFKDHKVTHVYINGWQVLAYWQALWAAKAMGLVTIFKGESNDLKPEISWKWPFKRFLLSLFFIRIDFFLNIGSANKRLYLRHGVSEDKILPGLYCIDNKRFEETIKSLNSSRVSLKNHWNIDIKKKCILFSGKFIDKKRPLDIIKAVEMIPQFKEKIHLAFVGDGILYESIKKSTQLHFDKGKKIDLKQSAKPDASIIGFLNQTDIAKAYAIADCLILPSDYNETWGLVVNEALASGVPVIVSDQCGSAEDLVKPISENLIFETGNIDRLKKSIMYLLDNPVSPNSLTNFIDKYNYQSTIDSMKVILNTK